MNNKKHWLYGITSETIRGKNLTKKEFIKRLSSVTDGGTNVGSLDNGKLFHGTISEDNFRFKRIKTFRNHSVIVKGEIKTQNNDLILNIKCERDFVLTFLPIFLLIMGATFYPTLLKKEDLIFAIFPSTPKQFTYETIFRSSFTITHIVILLSGEAGKSKWT